MLLEPLNRMKEADTRLNLTQGVLEGVVGEELGILPGMDSLFSALLLERFVGFLKISDQQSSQKDKFDIVIFDGIGSEETIRMIGATSKARLYLKYLRKLAEKTDLGRLAGPSLLRLLDETLGMSNRSSNLNGKLSSEVWDHLEQTLEKGSFVFEDSSKFACYLVVDSNNHLSLKSAERYWGCAIQAGALVSGAFAFTSPNATVELVGSMKKIFSPLPFSSMPHLSLSIQPDWNEILLNHHSQDMRDLLSLTKDNTFIPPAVKFDTVTKSITLLMPGFEKSEIKLYQFRGGSELLVEAGDQRRVIQLPPRLQGKVAGAKFTDRSLVITMR